MAHGAHGVAGPLAQSLAAEASKAATDLAPIHLLQMAVLHAQALIRSRNRAMRKAVL